MLWPHRPWCSSAGLLPASKRVSTARALSFTRSSEGSALPGHRIGGLLGRGARRYAGWVHTPHDLASARFRVTFENAAIGMALKGLDDRWLHVNRYLADMLGYRPDELVGMS